MDKGVNINNVIRIPTSLDGKFFRYWFSFLKPFHQLTEKEVDVMACFLKHRWELSKVIKDEAILNKVLMDPETKRKIMEECKVTLPYFQVMLSKFRKYGILMENNIINPRFIPNIEGENPKNFKLLLYFDLK